MLQLDQLVQQPNGLSSHKQKSENEVVIFSISFYENNNFSARSLSRRRWTPGMKLPTCLVFDNISKPPTNNAF